MTHPLSQNPFGENTLLDALLAASSYVMLICLSDAGGSRTIIAANDAALSRLGYRRKELLELELEELTDGLSSDRLFSESSKDSSFVEGARGLRCKNGDLLTGQLKVQHISQKEVELVLLTLEEQSFRNHFRHLPVPIFI